MDLPIMSKLAVTSLTIVLVVFMSSCVIASSNGSNENIPKYKFEDPEQYAVNSNNYPTYRIEVSVYRPPSTMVRGEVINGLKEELLNTDVWRVTHVYHDYFYIFSDEYQTRQEQLIKKSSSWNVIADYYFYHLPIDKTGKVVGGWVSFKNKKIVLLPSERRIVFDPNYWRNPEWDMQPSFKPVPRGSFRPRVHDPRSPYAAWDDGC